jgi:hypothetical protein
MSPPRRHQNSQKAHDAAKKEKKHDKYRGTIATITKDEGTLVLTLTDGTKLTIPTNKVRVIDAKTNRSTKVSVYPLSIGINVVVKVEKGNDESVREAKIKIVP